MTSIPNHRSLRSILSLLPLLLLLLLLPLLLPLGGCRGCCGKCFAGADRSSGKIPVLRAPKVKAGAIRVDGRLNEAAWKRAGRTDPFVNPGNGREPRRSPVKATAHIAWDDQALYVGCTVHDANPGSPFSRDAVDPHIWTRSSAVELMIQPGDPGHNRHYKIPELPLALRQHPSLRRLFRRLLLCQRPLGSTDGAWLIDNL